MFLFETKHRSRSVWMAAAAALFIAPGGAVAEAHHDDDHVLLRAGDIAWSPGPDLYGDPGAEGEFAARFRFPEGFELAPHIHNQVEIVTVISGTYNIGMAMSSTAMRRRPSRRAISTPSRPARRILPSSRRRPSSSSTALGPT